MDKEEEIKEAIETLGQHIRYLKNVELGIGYGENEKAIEIVLRELKNKDKRIEELEKELKEERTEKAKMYATIHKLIRKDCYLTYKLETDIQDAKKEWNKNMNNFWDGVRAEAQEILKIAKGENK